MSFDGENFVRPQTKIAVILRDNLENWQALNVTAFLVSGIAATIPEVVGQPYEDASGVEYLPMFGQPVLIFSGDAERLQNIHRKALDRHVALSVFTADLFATGNDVDNRAAVAAADTGSLDLVGIGIHGPKNQVDKIIKGVALYR